jgi:predicted RNase H-like nuclease (RuvC/YqgF family)
LLNFLFPLTAPTSPTQPAKHKHSIRSTFGFGPKEEKKKKHDDPKLDSQIASAYVTEETAKLKTTVDQLEANNSELTQRIASLSNGILQEKRKVNKKREKVNEKGRKINKTKKEK